MKVKKGDLVKVIAGKIKGSVTEVTSVDTENSRVFLENGPIVKKHLKPERSKKHPEGGIIEKSASIHISNVMIMCEAVNRPVRVGYSIDGDKKVRIAKGSKSSGQMI